MGDRVESTVLRLAYDVLAILITVAVAMLIGWLKKKLGVEGRPSRRGVD